MIFVFLHIPDVRAILKVIDTHIINFNGSALTV